MMRGLVLYFVMFALAGPAHATLAPELEIANLDAVPAALDAPLEPLKPGEEGALVLGRDVIGGESARRVETCRAINRAREEGFTIIMSNQTAFFADWLMVRCEVLGILESAHALGEGGLSDDWAITAPALFSSRTDCIGSYRALAATLKGQSWSDFETNWRAAFGGAAAGPARFVLLDDEPALNGFAEQGAIGVWAQDALHLGLRDGPLEIRIELLASADLNGDGLDEWIMLHRLEDEISAIEEWRVHLFTKTPAGLFLYQPERAVEKLLMACPDQLASLLADPCLLDADAVE